MIPVVFALALKRRVIMLPVPYKVPYLLLVWNDNLRRSVAKRTYMLAIDWLFSMFINQTCKIHFARELFTSRVLQVYVEWLSKNPQCLCGVTRVDRRVYHLKLIRDKFAAMLGSRVTQVVSGVPALTEVYSREPYNPGVILIVSICVHRLCSKQSKDWFNRGNRLRVTTLVVLKRSTLTDDFHSSYVLYYGPAFYARVFCA